MAHTTTDAAFILGTEVRELERREGSRAPAFGVLDPNGCPRGAVLVSSLQQGLKRRRDFSVFG